MFDKKANKKILFGYCDRNGFEIRPFKSWYDSEYNSYTVKTKELNSANIEKLKEVKITIIMASWCSDSRREVPRMYKILDHCKYSDKNITLINVDTKKKAGSIDIEDYNIVKVPTIIFYANKKEIGRIIETPNKSLEADMNAILFENGNQ